MHHKGKAICIINIYTNMCGKSLKLFLFCFAFLFDKDTVYNTLRYKYFAAFFFV